MLLRNRSRAVTKPSLMADHSSSSSSSQPSAPPNQSYARRTTIPSLFGSPKFRDFTNKCLLLCGTESLRSPTSILDTRGALSPLGFLIGNNSSNNKRTQNIAWDKNSDSKQGIIGLAIVGALKDEEEAAFDKNSCGEHNKGNHNNNVLFGTQLRTKDSTNSGIYAAKDSSPPPAAAVKGVLSLSEMELCEEYTRVTSHGPNPRTTHIFNNCIVEGYFSLPQKPPPSCGNSFLSFCYACKKKLDHTKDIFIYRGEKAFCSPECRQREMVLDGVESFEFDII